METNVAVSEVLKRRIYEAMDIMRSGWNVDELSHTSRICIDRMFLQASKILFEYNVKNMNKFDAILLRSLVCEYEYYYYAKH
jgi:hypothetical protein